MSSSPAGLTPSEGEGHRGGKKHHHKRGDRDKRTSSHAKKKPSDGESGHKKKKSHVGEGIDDFIHDDAHHLVEHFKHSWNSVNKSLKRPNVLLAGITGVGKSSVVNSIFGCKMAVEGAGKPITQNFSKYEHESKSVIVYDSKGLETGNIDEFVEQTREFFEEHRYTKKKKAENCIHVIWYVINSAGCRIQPSEEKLWREVFNVAPLMFLLNKSDISSEEDRKTLRELIRGMELPNLVGIYDCKTQKYANASPPSICGNCGSDDLMIRAKKKMWKCGDCGEEGTMVYTTGLEQVIGETIKVLPKVAREAFISAQTVSFSSKEERAKIVIREFSNDYRQIRMSSTLLVHIAKMLTRLSILWDFKEHGHLYGKQIAEELLTSFSLRDKVYLFMHRNKHAHWRAVALGVLWNRCVRYLARRVFHDSIELEMSLRDLDEEWGEVLTETFQHLTEANLDEVEIYLNSKGLEAVLEKEMPSVGQAVGVRASQPNIRVGYSTPVLVPDRNGDDEENTSADCSVGSLVFEGEELFEQAMRDTDDSPVVSPESTPYESEPTSPEDDEDEVVI